MALFLITNYRIRHTAWRKKAISHLNLKFIFCIRRQILKPNIELPTQELYARLGLLYLPSIYFSFSIMSWSYNHISIVWEMLFYSNLWNINAISCVSISTSMASTITKRTYSHNYYVISSETWLYDNWTVFMWSHYMNIILLYYWHFK